MFIVDCSLIAYDPHLLWIVGQMTFLIGWNCGWISLFTLAQYLLLFCEIGEQLFILFMVAVVVVEVFIVFILSILILIEIPLQVIFHLIIHTVVVFLFLLDDLLFLLFEFLLMRQTLRRLLRLDSIANTLFLPRQCRALDTILIWFTWRLLLLSHLLVVGKCTVQHYHVLVQSVLLGCSLRLQELLVVPILVLRGVLRVGLGRFDLRHFVWISKLALVVGVLVVHCAWEFRWRFGIMKMEILAVCCVLLGWILSLVLLSNLLFALARGQSFVSMLFIWWDCLWAYCDHINTSLVVIIWIICGNSNYRLSIFWLYNSLWTCSILSVLSYHLTLMLIQSTMLWSSLNIAPILSRWRS